MFQRYYVKKSDSKIHKIHGKKLAILAEIITNLGGAWIKFTYEKVEIPLI